VGINGRIFDLIGKGLSLKSLTTMEFYRWEAFGGDFLLSVLPKD
jgi:hypothetical protein